MVPFLLVFFGLLLIFIEFYLPGGVVGAIGGILIFAGIVLFGMQNHSPLAVFLFIIITLFLVGVLIRFALWRIPRANPNRSIYLTGDQTGYYASSFDKSAIGAIGMVTSDLKPGGHIMIDGKVHQAISISGYIQKGTRVKVIRGEGESLVVKKLEE